MKITTNNQIRPILHWWELTEKEKKEFDYLDTENERDFSSFFRYKGQVYDLGEFMRVGNIPEFKGWDGYASDSFFSGVLVKYPVDEWGSMEEGIIVGWYYS